MDTLTTGRIYVVLQGHRAIICVNDMARLLVKMANPFRKLPSIRNSSGQEDKVHVIRQEDNSLFPDHTALFVSHVMNFIKYHPSDFSNDFRASVQHAA